MRHGTCRVLPFIVVTCVLWQIADSGLDIDYVGQIVLIFGGALALACAARLPVDWGRVLHSLLIVGGIGIAVFVVIAFLQSAELRQLLQDLIDGLTSVIVAMLAESRRLPIVLAVLAAIAYGVLRTERSSST